jgi:MHS family proline/betaine transporter-like MFS transporter
VVEWYDFTLYLYFATVLSRVFFGPGEAALSATLATFAAAYLLRPLGGFVFGHIGDRFGRRRTMLLSVALMTVTMLGAALLPTHAQAGGGWLASFSPPLRDGLFGRRRIYRSRRLSA